MSEFVRIFFGTVFGKTVDEVRGIISTLDTERWSLGEEVCPTTQRKHLHFYIELTKKRRFTALGKLFGCHIEPIKNHPKSGKPMHREAWDYTQKDKVYISQGEPPAPEEHEAKEDKFAVCIKLASEGLLHEIRDRYPSMYVCHLSKWKLIAQERQTKEEMPDRICIWLHGKAGIGKSRWVYSHFPSAYRKNAGEVQFERYQQEPVIVIEDYLPEHRSDWKYQILLLSDRYPSMMKVRYGSACMAHKLLICTSNYRLNEVFPSDPSRYGESPWQRRFIEIEAIAWNNDKHDLEISYTNRVQHIYKEYLRTYLFKYYIIF